MGGGEGEGTRGEIKINSTLGWQRRRRAARAEEPPKQQKIRLCIWGPRAGARRGGYILDTYLRRIYCDFITLHRFPLFFRLSSKELNDLLSTTFQLDVTELWNNKKISYVKIPRTASDRSF